MKRKYYSLEKTNDTATINIYGDITSWPWLESDVSSYNLSRQLEEMKDVSNIDVFINSYGGEVAEGLAIYNALKRHNAKVTTYCDGFACSIASVIFMAGDERVMSEASLLMIHNAWTFASGNAEQLRKQADDLEIITQASVEAYKKHATISEEEIKSLMDKESWIKPADAVEYGFATEIESYGTEKASQNAFMKLFEIIQAYQAEDDEEEEEREDGTTEGDDTSTEDDDTSTDTSTEDDEEVEESDGEEKKEDEEKTATQQWSGFFNAIINGFQ